MELNEEHLKVAETQLKRYLPRSLMVYGLLMLRNRVPSDPMAFFVDEWPNFNVFICRPQCVQRVDLFKDILVFANDENILEETLKKSSVIDWSRYLCFGFSCQYTETFKAVASEKGVPGRQVAVCHMMILDDVSTLPDVDSSRITLSSLDESHISLVNQTWTLGKSDESLHMIRSMVTNFPSCCVLDAEGKPVAWILVYSICAMGMLHTLPEHREKGYAKVLICSMAKRLHAEGYPVYCLIDEDNTLSYKIFKNLGFTEDPSFRGEWFEFNEL
ncbi:glycine N-acyltransferase-like protein 3 isoform X2 [Cheilinus undulatus]|uniref:glycine N-acyltransferase-like protein 3 isoform X2 n=1 Tax=Cheilinus undulatus TaxID=241271 RepID=UPI001BD3F02D|nr:glycine N-acyltransferase-like protein 3 isoform X2 [Cheilinus undulatus]